MNTTKKIMLLLGVCLMLFSTFYFKKRMSGAEWTKQILETQKAKFEKMQQDANRRIDRIDRIENCINDSDLKTANIFLDTFLMHNQELSYHLYNGMIMERKGLYSEAIIEYSWVINHLPASNALDRRAHIYTLINKYELAKEDYWKLLELNRDYCLQIGDLYYTLGSKDSALFYYNNYLENHPNDSVVKKKG